MTKEQIKELREDANWIEQRAQKVPPSWPDRVGYMTELAKLKMALNGSGASVHEQRDGSWAIKWHGIKVTCTAGLVGACGNWATAARKKASEATS